MVIQPDRLTGLIDFCFSRGRVLDPEVSDFQAGGVLGKVLSCSSAMASASGNRDCWS